MDFRFEEPAEFRGADSVKTPRGLVEKKDPGLVEQCAEKAEALESAGGKSANLAFECAAEFEAFCQLRYASSEKGIGEVIQPAEEAKIFSTGQARIETEVSPGVVTKMAADGSRIPNGITSGKQGRATRGDKQRRKYAK